MYWGCGGLPVFNSPGGLQPYSPRNPKTLVSRRPLPQSPKLNALITRYRESYSSVRTSRESKRLKKSSNYWLNSHNALIQRVKNTIFVFSVLPRNAEAQVIWGGIVKCLLTDYFIDNISAKKYQNQLTCVKVIANQRWDVFLDTV